MNIGKNCTFWNLYKNVKIKIPQIQRDYVQGRNNPRVEANRKSFAKELVESLVNNKRITLNFIYGYYKDECFIPIDGQQRLTTLFLLHFLVFSKAGHKGDLLINERRNFSYETRYTTDRFLDALIKKGSELLDSDNVNQSITEASWYAYNWNNDPSVISALVMLSELKSAFDNKKYSNWNGYYNRLISENCPIRFMLLEMSKDQLGKPNQLYIRMNSRGKQLTDFENFKAALYDYAKTTDAKKDGLDELIKKAKEKIDGEWQTLVWEIPENYDFAEKYSDIFYRDLIHWIFINRLTADRFKLKGKNAEDTDWVIPTGKIISNIYLENYVDIAGPSLGRCIDDFMYAMNTFINIQKTDSACYNKIVKYLLNYKSNKGYYYCQLAEYEKRIILFAITKYGRESSGNFNLDQFTVWYRVIVNLAKNTEIDDPDIYCTICQTIDGFDGALSIADNPDVIGDLKRFKDSQIDEEIFKQKLIKSNPTWKAAVLEAEKLSYFQGEIMFILKLAGVTDPFNNANDGKLKEFEETMEKVKDIFRTDILQNESEDYPEMLLHRALLCFGDYSKKISPYDNDNNCLKSFCCKDTKHHKQDWRGMLGDENRFPVFKKMFDQFVKSGEEKFKDFAEDQIEKYSKSEGSGEENGLSGELRTCLIKDPELFKYIHNHCKIWYYKDSDTPVGSWYLLPNSKRGKYINYKLYAVYSYSSKINEFSATLQVGSSKTKESITVNGKTYSLNSSGEFTEGENNKAVCIEGADKHISSVEDMIEFIGLRPKA